MLGAKTSARIAGVRYSPKPIVSEPGISSTQLAEMRRSSLQLVIPSSLHGSYLPEQSGQLLDVRGFLDLVRSRQS